MKKKQARFNPNLQPRDRDQLRALRLEKGFGSQAAFADAVGISEKTVRAAEVGSRIRRSSANVIASVYGKSLGKLFVIPERRSNNASNVLHSQRFFGRSLNTKEMRCVREIAQSIGLNEARLIADVSKSMNDRGRLMRLLKFREQEHDIRQARKDTQLLARYYRDSLAEYGLGRYAIKVDEETVDTHIAVNPEGPFRIKLEEERSLFRAANSSFKPPRLAYRQIVDFTADSLLIGVRVKNEPVFSSVFALAEGLQRLQALDKERRYVDNS